MLNRYILHLRRLGGPLLCVRISISHVDIPLVSGGTRLVTFVSHSFGVAVFVCVVF